MNWLAWGRALRLSLAPSALADVAAGALVAGAGEAPPFERWWPLLLASSCVYHAGMAFNDYADRAHDAATRPDRPVPSGAVSARALRVLGFVLLAVSIGSAALVGARAAVWVAGMAALVLIYDFGPRGAWRGPLLLGACRASNLALGLFFASEERYFSYFPTEWMLAPLAYGAYVVAASRVARLEDRAAESEHGAPARGAALSAALLLLAPAFVQVHAEPPVGVSWPALALAALAAWPLFAAALRTQRWTPADCGRFTGMALRRLLVFSAALVLAHRGASNDALYVAAAILAGFPLSAALRRVFPPT
ncbi:MAG: UbiA family prenyltransferase [Planctomycetes bacterium]|nr:UbiA family prenyltransferase [Planctomycetota bacterium]